MKQLITIIVSLATLPTTAISAELGDASDNLFTASSVLTVAAETPRALELSGQDYAHSAGILPAKNGINRVSPNFDGSITVRKPRLAWEGRLISVAAGYADVSPYGAVYRRDESKLSATGICAILGKKTLVSSSTFENDGPLVAITLSAAGKFRGTIEGRIVTSSFEEVPTYSHRVIVIERVTCR